MGGGAGCKGTGGGQSAGEGETVCNAGQPEVWGGDVGMPCILWHIHTLESRLFFTDNTKSLHCMQSLAPIPPIDFLPRLFQVTISPLPLSSHQAALGEMSYESDAAERLRLEVRTVTAKWARLQVHQGEGGICE